MPASACRFLLQLWDRVRVQYESSCDQVVEREQINPNKIDQMQEQADQIHRRVVSIRKFAAAGAHRDPGQQSDSRQNVNAVQSGHHEIETEKRGVAVAAGDQIAVVRVEAAGQQPFFKFMRVLKILY